MSFEQSLSSRLVAIPVNIIIASALWLVPRSVYALCPPHQPRGLDEKSGGCAGLCHVPVAGVCVAILWSVGADWHQIVAAVSSNIVLSMMMGAVYGYFLGLLPPSVPRQ